MSSVAATVEGTSTNITIVADSVSDNVAQSSIVATEVDSESDAMDSSSTILAGSAEKLNKLAGELSPLVKHFRV